MIKTFSHKGLREFFERGSEPGINPTHVKKLSVQLGRLDEAVGPEAMNVARWFLHQLAGELAGHYSISVNGNWRATFRFEGQDAILVDYQDYH